MAKDWKRVAVLETAFNEMHRVKPNVDVKHINNNHYQVKLRHKGREVILTEKMKDGLTDEVFLEFNGVIKPFKSYYQAELAATAILKG